MIASSSYTLIDDFADFLVNDKKQVLYDIFKWEANISNKPSKQVKRVRVTEVATCPLKAYYRLNGYPPQLPKNLSLKSLITLHIRKKVGSAVEEALCSLLEKCYPSIKYTNDVNSILVQLADNCYLSGRPDALSGNGIIEIKLHVVERELPVSSHVKQLKIYSTFYNPDRYLLTGHLIYVSPQSITKTKVFKFDFSKEELDSVKDYCKHVCQLLSNPETKPEDMPYTDEDIHCVFCNFRHLCCRQQN